MSAAIQDHVAEHTRLTNEIEEIDYAPPTLEQVESQLNEVNKQLTGSRNALEKLEKATKKEYQEWADIRDRTSKRFWERVKHPRSYQEKLSDKESKEEREYLEAFEEERRLKAEIEAMEGEVASYENEIKNLKPLATQHERLRKSLEQLYERVFGGPTPSHPEEDQAEQAYQAALTHYNELQGRVTNESRAYDLLKQADRAMAMSYKNMTSALSASQFDMFGGGMGADMMERNALSEAQRCADQARMFVVQAKGLQPLIRDLSDFQVPRASMGDIFFDNIFTDMAMHDKIQQSAKRLQISHLELREVLSQSLSHLHGLEEQSRSVEGELNSARERLKGVRKGIMELAGESLPVYTGGAPPGYVPPAPAEQGQPQVQVQGQGRYYGNPFASSLEQQQY